MVVGIAGGSLLYSLYLNVLESVAGNKLVFFDAANYLKALFFVMPCVCIIICPIIAFAHIRRTGGVILRLFYVFLSLLTWIIILPITLCYGEPFLNRSNTRDSGLSSGYFRQEDNKVYYFAQDLSFYEDSTAIIIDTDRLGQVSVEKMDEISANSLYEKSYPYTDVLVKNTFKNGYLPKFVDFGVIIKNADSALNAGWSYWLAFLSLGLLLCSTYALSGLYAWKLVNVGNILAVTVVALFVNSYVLVNPTMYSAIVTINNLKFFAFLGQFMYEPFLVLLNIIFSVIIIIIGIIKLIIRKKNK